MVSTPTMQTDCTYQTMLRSELVSRIERNNKYSLRSFAKHLKLSPAFVSQVLNNRRTLSIETAHGITEALNWPDKMSKRFVQLVQLERVDDAVSRKKLQTQLDKTDPQFAHIKQDQFNVLSDWRYAALMEMTELDCFVSNERWIAQRLGITVIEAKDIIFRLLRSGLLVADDQGNMKKSQEYVAMTGPQAKKAIEQYHRRVLERAILATGDHIPEREFRSLIVPTDPTRLGEFKNRIRQFEDDMMEFMENGPRRSIFQMSIQLFRIDRETT